jgi:hypothetical protein
MAPASSSESGSPLIILADWSSIGFAAKRLMIQLVEELLADIDQAELIAIDRFAVDLLQTEVETANIITVT